MKHGVRLSVFTTSTRSARPTNSSRLVEIGTILGISPRTVTNLERIYARLGVRIDVRRSRLR